jgi:apolipoprotein N-acyltransferase
MMKKLISKELNLNIGLEKINPLWYLLAGMITMTASHMTFSIDAAAWISMVPFLIYLGITKGWKSRLLFTITLIITWSIITFKIVTPPIPFVLIFLYSIPISAFHLPGYLLWAALKHRKYSIFIFPASMVILEWLQYTFTPLASWGAAAYTQSESLSMMQVTSLFGLAGLSFLIYWVNISITAILAKGRTSLSTFQIPLVTIIILLLYGSLRLDISRSKGKETIIMAAIGTDSDIGAAPLPTREKNERDIIGIFGRTKKAVKLGAKIAVWNEGAFLLEPGYENAWIDSMQHLASGNNITLVASYILMTSETPMKYENKYLLIDATGQVLFSYLKHEPVPGEQAVKGREELKVAEIGRSLLGGAICYDYDFPYLAKGYGKIGTDLVALPSSDWRGIDPLHTRMAAFRAVEQGHSILRSTRFGLSAAITPQGEMISQMSSFDDNNKIMIASLPVKKASTLYAVWGDVFVYLCFFPFILLIIVKDDKDYWMDSKT